MISQSQGGNSEDDLISEVGSDISVAVDRWSAGHLGWTDVIVAFGVLAGAAVLAFVARRLVRRLTREWEGPAAAAGQLAGQLVSVAIYLFATAMVLEILGFSLGPVMILVLVVIVAILFLSPVVKNLSSGFVLQLRGSFKPGDLVESRGSLGVVQAVSTRAVVLVTGDGRTVHIPNNQFVDETLVNYSTIGRRRSEMSLLLPEAADAPRVAAQVVEVVRGLDGVLDDPAPEVVVTEFDGAQPSLKVLFWHDPGLSSERAARHQVGSVLADLTRSADLVLADPSLVVRTVGSAD